MTDLTTIIVLAVVVIVVAAVAVTVATMLRKRRSASLREQFGPEYDRTLREADDPVDAEKELEQRRRRHRSLRLRDLEPREREGYRQRWTQVQQGFVDDPGTAVRESDRLVAEVMSARGYPVEDVDQQAEDLSVAYPVVTQRYREARRISGEYAAGRAGTEDLRHAVTSYRALDDALLEDDGGAGDGGGAPATDDRRTDPDGGAPADRTGHVDRNAGHGRNGGPASPVPPPRQEYDARRETRT